MFLASLSHRNRQPEIMDQPDLDPQRHLLALRGLARINFISGSARILWPELALAAKNSAAPLRVLDIATGAGDVPIRLWQRAKRAGLPITFAGCDLSSTALQHARHAAGLAGADIQFFEQDILKNGIPAGFDVITCSLFLHHLDDAEIIPVLRSMRQAAGRLVLINDLSRSRFGYLLAWFGSRILSRSDVVHVDGPLSVRAAFTPEEALLLAEEGGMTGAKVVRRWPCRFLLSWRRP
jgi:2-polyprenyl-3-methyl-5-hydroxy-6-metoxy-1,4-benzoquinol methylase